MGVLGQRQYMHTCDVCGAEFETLSRMRMDHDPCPVAEERRKQEAAEERLEAERGFGIGDTCRVIETGEEVRVVDVEPESEGDLPTVVRVPADHDDSEAHRQRGSADELV